MEDVAWLSECDVCVFARVPPWLPDCMCVMLSLLGGSLAAWPDGENFTAASATVASTAAPPSQCFPLLGCKRRIPETLSSILRLVNELTD